MKKLLITFILVSSYGYSQTAPTSGAYETDETNPKEVFEATAEQVQNIPDELDNLIIPTGVAIQTAGILIGLKRYNKKVNRIVCVCVGPTREKKLAGYFKDVYEDTWKSTNKINTSITTPIKIKISSRT